MGLYTLDWWITWYVSYISIKPPKKEKASLPTATLLSWMPPCDLWPSAPPIPPFLFRLWVESGVKGNEYSPNKSGEIFSLSCLSKAPTMCQDLHHLFHTWWPFSDAVMSKSTFPARSKAEHLQGPRHPTPTPHFLLSPLSLFLFPSGLVCLEPLPKFCFLDDIFFGKLF